MSRIYKICVLNQLNESENRIFAIKPYLESFDSFKDEIYIRMPELKNQPLKLYYQDSDGDNITIFNALDFGIFQEQKINKVYVEYFPISAKNGPVKSVSFQSNASFVSAAPAAPTTPIASSSASVSTPQLVLHPNVICDGCDKEIYGYRYKCLECADFDLCMECQPKMHNHHLMIRIADPSDAEICYKSKLGKRFLRHRRSESLCSKSDEKEKKHHHHHPHPPHPHPHHHKRHASSASGVRPPTVGDVIASVLHTFAGTNNNPSSNEQPLTNTESTNTPPTAAENQPKKTTTGTNTTSTSTATSTSAPSYGFNVGAGAGKPPCVKNGIDMLSHVAHNFAAMMDPFATFMEQSANAYASAASAASAATTSAASATNTTTSSQTNAGTVTEIPVTVTDVIADQESATDKQSQNEEKSADKQDQKISDEVMIVDCSDDEDEDEQDLRKLVTALNRNSIDAHTSTENKKDEQSASIEADKGSPSREWTFIDSNEIAESAGASGSSTGAIPKKTTPPPQADNSGSFNKVDYAELSRLLSTHIDTQQNQATPTAPPQPDDKAQPEATEKAAKSTKTPPPTPLHPDARVNEALNAMMAMGFSNEGGWLTQLLETVDGSISNALDLLQPHK